jgi:hypothetical protein
MQQILCYGVQLQNQTGDIVTVQTSDYELMGRIHSYNPLDIVTILICSSLNRWRVYLWLHLQIGYPLILKDLWTLFSNLLNGMWSQLKNSNTSQILRLMLNSKANAHILHFCHNVSQLPRWRSFISMYKTCVPILTLWSTIILIRFSFAWASRICSRWSLFNIILPTLWKTGVLPYFNSCC